MEQLQQAHQRVGFGLPPLVIQAILQHSGDFRFAQVKLLSISRTVRNEVLLCAPALTYNTGVVYGGALRKSQGLRQLLSQRSEPLELTLDLDKDMNGLETMVAFLACIEATQRPAHGVHGAPTCCVRKLMVKGAESMQDWGSLLGSSFPSIASLHIPLYQQWVRFRGDVVGEPLSIAVLRGLSSCSHLTSLSLLAPVHESGLSECQQLLPRWLPHVRSLEVCGRQGASLVAALGPQLHHLVYKWADGEERQGRPHISTHLPTCQQLASLTIHVLDDRTVKAVLQLQRLRTLVVTGYLVKLQEDYSNARWGVQSLSLLGTVIQQADVLIRLPLSCLQSLKIRPWLSIEVPTSAAEASSMVRAACTAVARVPDLQLCKLHMRLTPLDLDSVGTPQALEAALAALQPIAHALSLAPRFVLSLEGFGTSPGGEVLRGLHAAFGSSRLSYLDLTLNSIGVARTWAAKPAFWSTLPHTLPQLSTLVLRAGLVCGSGDSMDALHDTCARLKQSSSGGMRLKVVMRELDEGDLELMQDVVQQLSVYQPEVCIEAKE